MAAARLVPALAATAATFPPPFFVLVSFVKAGLWTAQQIAYLLSFFFEIEPS
jgi:hypothetical protein